MNALKSMSKTILITGASSGFGRDTAETLFRAGHIVYASMRGTEAKNREAAEALRKLGIMTVELDVSDDASVEAGVKKVLAEAGKIDVLINNAGIGSAGVTEAFTAEQAEVVSKTTSACSAVNASVTPADPMPALLISTSILPASASTFLTPASTDASSLTSNST